MVQMNWEPAWDYVWNLLYRNGMFYDARTAYAPDGATRDLPTPEEIRQHVPNACAWNTGMENGAMMCGDMFDTLTSMYEVTGERHPNFDRLIETVRTLSTIAGVPGFLARAVAPDGKSFYTDSSRDQYTHVIYGICRFLDSGAATEAEREELTGYVVGYAAYAEACVTPETNYYLRRSDGGRGMVSRMWGEIGAHEYLRLPMFYIAAWHLSGDPHWLEKYREVRDEAIEKSALTMPRWQSRNCILKQMQYSVRLCYDYETDEAVRAKYVALGDRIIELTLLKVQEGKMIETIQEAVASGRKFDTLRPVWRRLPMVYLYEDTCAIQSEYPYYIPQLPGTATRDLWDLNEIASAVTNIVESPARRTPPPELVQALADCFACVDFERHATESPVYMLNAYWALRHMS